MSILLCFFFGGCTSESNPVFELLTLRTEVKEHYTEYTHSDWEYTLTKYSDICKDLDNMQLSNEERIEIEKVKGEIAGYASTIAAQEITNDVYNIVKEIESFADGFNNTFQQPQIPDNL